MDEFDLLARDAPPPRHQLESDSEDSGDDQPAGPERSHSQPSLPRAELTWLGTPPPAPVTGKALVVLEGPACDSYLAGLATSTSSSAPASGSGSIPSTVGHVLAGVGHVPQALVVPAEAEDKVYVLVRPSPSVTALPEAAVGLAYELVGQLKPKSLVLLTSYNAGTYIQPWTDPREHQEADQDGDTDGEYGHTVRYLAHGYTAQALATLRGVARLTVPNYLVGLGAGLTSAALEQGAGQVLVIAAPSLAPQPHGLYRGTGLAKADAQWALAYTRTRTPPRFGPEHQAAIATALEAASPRTVTALGGLPGWAEQEWKRAVPAATVAEEPTHVIGDGNLYL